MQLDSKSNKFAVCVTDNCDVKRFKDMFLNTVHCQVDFRPWQVRQFNNSVHLQICLIQKGESNWINKQNQYYVSTNYCLSSGLTPEAEA